MLTFFLLLHWAVPVQGLPPAEGAWEAKGAMRISISSKLFELKEVKRYLESGLTTTFRIEVNGRDGTGHATRKQVAIAVRYELWEEAYLVVFSDENGSFSRQELSSMEAFRTWWRKNVLVLDGLRPFSSGAVRVVLEIVPFSAAETETARRWLSKTLNGPVDGRRPNPGSSITDLGGSLVSTVVATSIKRKVLMRFQWKVKPTGRPP